MFVQLCSKVPAFENRFQEKEVDPAAGGYIRAQLLLGLFKQSKCLRSSFLGTGGVGVFVELAGRPNMCRSPDMKSSNLSTSPGLVQVTTSHTI